MSSSPHVGGRVTGVSIPGSPSSPFSALSAMSPTAGSKPPITVKEAMDVLLFGELNSAQVKKLVFELSAIITNFGDFAEEFLDRAGLQLIVDLVKKASGSNIQGHLLFVLKALLNYVNAIEAVKEQPELVDKIYYLLAPHNTDPSQPAGAAPLNLTAAKATLEVLIVLCHVLPNGRELIHDAAKRRAGPEQKPYAILAPYLSCSDLLCVRNCLLFMNVLLKKSRDESEYETKNLVLRWQESGLMNLLKPLTSVEDPLVKQQLATFQKLADVVIPRSWVAAEKYRIMYDDMKKRYESANESLFLYQQQQAKIRLMKLEFQRATETLKLMGVALPGVSRLPHPNRRFEHGGGLTIKELGSGQTVDVEINQDTVKDTTTLRKSMLEKFLTSIDIRDFAVKTLGVAGLAGAHHGGGGGHGHGRAGPGKRSTYLDPNVWLHNDDPPPPTDSDDDGSLPPSDDSGDDGDLPPSDDSGDEGPPGAKRGGGKKKPSGKPPRGGAGVRGGGGGGGGGPPSGPPSDDDGDFPDDEFPDDDGPKKPVLKFKGGGSGNNNNNSSNPAAVALLAAQEAAVAAYATEKDALGAQTAAQIAALTSGLDPTAAMKVAREVVAALKAGTLTAESVEQHKQQQQQQGAAVTASSTSNNNNAASAGSANNTTTAAATNNSAAASNATAKPAATTATTPAVTATTTAPSNAGVKMPPLGGRGKMPPIGGKGPMAAKDEVQWYKGNAPTKKMRPLHWDKIALAAVDGTVWSRIHNDSTYDLSYDFDEFEGMFSQKEVVKEEKKEKKKEEVMLVDPKTFMNFSIMLHKLPPIPTIQRAILELDNQTLKKDQIQSLQSAAEPKSLPQDTIKEFRTKQDLKPVAEYNGPEQFVAMVLSMGDVFKPRLAAWTFTLSWKESMETLRAPLARASVVMDAVLTSQHFPYFLAILLSFGNVMNHGSPKGNAPAIMLNVLGKIDATKDNRGKTSLMQHLLNTARQRNPQSLDLAEELKCVWKEQGGANGLKLDDLEKSVSEAEGSVNQFNNNIAAVKRLNADNPMAGSDPFVPTMTQFLAIAQVELEEAKHLLEEAKKRYKELVKYFGYPEKRAPKLEEMLIEVVNFVAKVRKVSEDALKDKKKIAQKGKKLDGHGIDGVVGQLQEQLVHS